MKRLSWLIILITLTVSIALPCFGRSEGTVKRVLDNGLTVVVKPEPGNGLVAIAAMVRVGVGQESIQTAGLGNFVSRLLLASTRAKSAEQVASIADSLGGNIGAEWERDLTSIRTVTTSTGFDRTMNLIGECLAEANFEPQWVEHGRGDLLAYIKSKSSDPFDDAYSDLRQLLYEDNGYRRPKSVSERAITLATPQDLRRYFAMYYPPNNIVLSIAGDVTADRAIDRVRRAFAGVIARKLPIDRGVPNETLKESKRKISESRSNTGYLLAGWLAPRAGSEDYPAMAVAANALGGGKGSLMFQDLRQKQGLGYEIGVIYPKLRYQSHLVAYMITDPYKNAESGSTAQATLEKSEDELMKLVERLKTRPLSDKELQRAKGYTIGTYALSHQHLLDRAVLLGWSETIGLGWEFDVNYADMIDKVTAADVQRVANKYFANRATIVLVPKRM
ncbi:MAG: M16 family metallopeptidase [Armatimonadota bacterium]|jgi:zinc protease